MPTADADSHRIDALTDAAEKAIQKILRDLEDETFKSVDQVNVDTRNFANCATEIFLK